VGDGRDAQSVLHLCPCKARCAHPLTHDASVQRQQAREPRTHFFYIDTIEHLTNVS
jgi:hypothetical protein